MSYIETTIDGKLRSWFQNDFSHALLRRTALIGRIRGLKSFSVSYDFPISVIAGRNGSGKTTMLALAACAFHGSDDGFRLPSRRAPYYTLSDFLIQSKDEVSLDGVTIYQSIAHDNWKVTKNNLSACGVNMQSLTKQIGGKWRSYSDRISRPVIFIGIDRVVPHSEKSVSKSYRSAFKISIDGSEEKVLKSVGHILGSSYEEFHFKKHYKYRLPFVKRGGVTYSGFNMGAGENALFEIIYNLHVCPVGTLVIVDEIELGLHQEAQRRLMGELKNICLDRKIQIICTTHSPAILAEIPPDGRYYVHSNSASSTIIQGITPRFATGLMSGRNSGELTIYVEDVVAADLLTSVFEKNTRSRVSVIPIGSDAAVISLMAGLRKENKKEKVLAILDGDKANALSSRWNFFCKKLESYKDKDEEVEWIKSRLLTLPGEKWPEQWAVTKLKACVNDSLLQILGVTKSELTEIACKAELAGKHNEFFALASELYLDEIHIRKTISTYLAKIYKDEFSTIIQKVENSLVD